MIAELAQVLVEEAKRRGMAREKVTEAIDKAWSAPARKPAHRDALMKQLREHGHAK